jgi:hypothetical protein
MGLLCLFLEFLVGIFTACFKIVPSPGGTNAVPGHVLAARSLLAASAVAGSVALGEVNRTAGGMLSVFPAIFLTTMTGLWLSQGDAVPLGAIGPMIIGAVSVPIYAITFSLLLSLERMPISLAAIGAFFTGCTYSAVTVTVLRKRVKEDQERRERELADRIDKDIIFPHAGDEI